MFILHSAQHNTAKDTNMTIVYAGHYTLLIVITMTRQHKNVTSPQSILWTLTFWPWAHTAYSASVHHCDMVVIISSKLQFYSWWSMTTLCDAVTLTFDLDS